MIKVYQTKERFLSAFETFLEVDEIKNNLMISISKKTNIEHAYFVSSMIEHQILGRQAPMPDCRGY